MILPNSTLGKVKPGVFLALKKWGWWFLKLADFGKLAGFGKLAN